MEWGSVADWAQAVPVAVASAAAVFAYWRDVALKKTDWLFTIFEKFYETDVYKMVRRTLDSPQSPELKRLRDLANEDADSEMVEAIVDYLNFFEFLCNLVERRRMSKEDMSRMFDYYLRNLSEHDFVHTYCKKHGFEALGRELHRRATAYDGQR